ASPFWIMLLLFLARLEHGRIPALARKTARADPLLRGFTNSPCTGRRPGAQRLHIPCWHITLVE
ncbi:MAG: hypothetical protein ACREO5_15275, partial [Candidatus Binatia bacterium]